MANVKKTAQAIDETVKNVIKPEAEKMSKATAKAAKATADAAEKAAKATSGMAEKAMKAAAEAAGKAAVKTAEKVTEVKKAVKKEEMILQYGGKEKTYEEIMECAREQYLKDGHKKTDLKSIKVYVKPEEGMAYYVANDHDMGRIHLF